MLPVTLMPTATVTLPLMLTMTLTARVPLTVPLPLPLPLSLTLTLTLTATVPALVPVSVTVIAYCCQLSRASSARSPTRGRPRKAARHRDMMRTATAHSRTCAWRRPQA